MNVSRWAHLLGHAIGGALILFILSTAAVLGVHAIVPVPSPYGQYVIWVATLFGAASAARGKWATDLRRERQSHGLCVRCGYDLRGGHARCPECGGTP